MGIEVSPILRYFKSKLVGGADIEIVKATTYVLAPDVASVFVYVTASLINGGTELQ